MKNAIHIHHVSRTSKASGHIDDITFARAWCFVCQNIDFISKKCHNQPQEHGRKFDQCVQVCSPAGYREGGTP